MSLTKHASEHRTLTVPIGADLACAFGGCDRATLSKGLCSGHYAQNRSKGELSPLRPRATSVPGTCQFDGCVRKFFAKGLCRSHYSQMKRGNPLAPLMVFRETCSFPGCGKAHSAHGLCDGHNIQRRKGGEITPLRLRLPAGDRRCSIPGCGKPHIARDLCMRHYNAWHWESPIGRATRREALSRRRARRLSAESRTVTRRDIGRMIHRYRGLCAYGCGRAWEHMDHVIPLSRGGRHSIGNLLPACARCNLTKRAMFVSEWKARGTG